MYKLIEEVKAKTPLVLNYTNEVTINDCANIILALGASPLMSYSYEEVEDIVSVADAVVINIGTMKSENIELFVQAGKLANKHKKPVVLDPVGVFATKARTMLVKRMLDEIDFDVIKGNASEIKFIGGFEVKGKGVDSFDETDDIEEMVKTISKKLGCVIVATGKTDIVSDGERTAKIENGSAKLKSVTGTGCMTAALVGSYLGTGKDPFECASMGVLTMSLAGELADGVGIGIGGFKSNLMDSVYGLDVSDFETHSKIGMI